MIFSGEASDTDPGGNNGDAICIVCGREVAGAHRCNSCGHKVHIICGIPDQEKGEGYGQALKMCFNCSLSKGIKGGSRVSSKSSRTQSEVYES